jgi:hypothetical protein
MMKTMYVSTKPLEIINNWIIFKKRAFGFHKQTKMHALQPK